MSFRISNAFEMYRRDYIVFSNQSRKTEESSGLAGRSIMSFLGDMPLADLTFQDVRNWKEHLEHTLSQNTVRCYIIKLRVVIKYARLRGYECINEATITPPKRQNKVVDFLTEPEVERLIWAVSQRRAGYSDIQRLRNIAIVCLLYASGIRVGELCAMNRTDIKCGDTFTVIGKGNKPRLCFIDERAQNAISAYLMARTDDNPALFVSELNKKRITKDVVQLIFRIASKLAGFLKAVHPHTMRHSFATNLLRNNTNLVYVRDFLGHKSVQTTEMYTHVVNEDLHKIYLAKHTI